MRSIFQVYNLTMTPSSQDEKQLNFLRAAKRRPEREIESSSGATLDYRIEELAGQRLLLLEGEERRLARVQDMLDLIAEALPRRVNTVVVPVTRLDPSFFQLRSGLAGELAQKIVNYRLKLAVVGDVAAFIADSKAFADFVRESNRGASILFVQDMDELAKKLSAFEGL